MEIKKEIDKKTIAEIKSVNNFKIFVKKVTKNVHMTSSERFFKNHLSLLALMVLISAFSGLISTFFYLDSFNLSHFTGFRLIIATILVIAITIAVELGSFFYIKILVFNILSSNNNIDRIMNYIFIFIFLVVPAGFILQSTIYGFKSGATIISDLLERGDEIEVVALLNNLEEKHRQDIDKIENKYKKERETIIFFTEEKEKELKKEMNENKATSYSRETNASASLKEYQSLLITSLQNIQTNKKAELDNEYAIYINSKTKLEDDFAFSKRDVRESNEKSSNIYIILGIALVIIMYVFHFIYVRSEIKLANESQTDGGRERLFRNEKKRKEIDNELEDEDNKIEQLAKEYNEQPREDSRIKGLLADSPFSELRRNNKKKK